MVRRSPTHALRTCTSFFTSATSPSWPGPTRPTTIKLLCLATLLAATQLGLCAALAHKLLAMRLEVECWEVDDEHAGEGGSAGLDMLSLVPKTHKLPVTFVNLDRLEGRGGSEGAMWLSLGKPGGAGGKL
ncbi:hypothetical protein J3E71DRAFT_243584 [Bipolaris maydis]|nr:hypothetical protein J3E71DRAFT_243584 [Bipolaris maydis]